jgi:hypothetical protein
MAFERFGSKNPDIIQALEVANERIMFYETMNE